MKKKTELKKKLIAAERLLHNEGFLSESERARLWRRFDKAFTGGKWPTAIRDLGIVEQGSKSYGPWTIDLVDEVEQARAKKRR